MPIVTLTDRFCAGAKAKARTDFYDSKTRGLVLRVSPAGRKTWGLIFTSPAGKRSRLDLGVYPQLSLARARALAVEGQGSADQGIDPRGISGNTVAELAEHYLERHAAELRSGASLMRRIRKNVIPVIGHRPLADLHRRDLNRVLDPMVERGAPVEATRVFEDMRAMFRWAVARGDLDYSPMEGMRKPAKSAPRERVLSNDELATLWGSLPEALPRSKAVRDIIKLCILTAQRVGEVAGMTRAEVDLRERIWRIPAARSKNKHAHVVPLSDGAIAIIKEARGARYVFPDNGSGALSGHAVAHTIRLAQNRFGLAQWSAHDLRRTAVTGMAELGISPIVLAHVVNHRSVSKAGVTLGVYSHYDYAREKREALELWADRVAGIVGAGAAKVLPMRGGRV